MQDSFEDIDETKDNRVIAKYKATFDRPHTAELRDKSIISTEDPPCYDGTEASLSKLTKGKTAVITKNNPLGEHAGATPGKKTVVNDPDKSLR